MDDEITTMQLAEMLGTTHQRIGSWVRKGMPFESRNGSYRFAPSKVEAWLLEQGLIEEADEELPGTRVATGRAECAREWGVAERTISGWQHREGFPGRPADPGKKNGYYPLDEIDEWLVAQGIHPTKSVRRAGGGAMSDADEQVKRERIRLLEVQRAERELRLAEKRGELIEVATVTAFIARQINQAGPLIDEIPDRALAKLPPDLSQEARDAIYNDFVGLATDIRAVLGELVAGDLDDGDEGKTVESD